MKIKSFWGTDNIFYENKKARGHELFSNVDTKRFWGTDYFSSINKKGSGERIIFFKIKKVLGHG